MLNLANNTVYIAIIVSLIGFLIVLAPVILNNEKIRNFTIDTFNLVLLVFIAIALSLLDVRVGVVFTILLLAFLSYAKLEGATFSHPNFYGESVKPTEYAEQFKLLTPQVAKIEKSEPALIETFTNNTTANTTDTDSNNQDCGCGEAFCNCNSNKEGFMAPVPDGSSTDDLTVSNAMPTQDTSMTSNVGSYMNQLQQDAITKKLKTNVNNDFDTIGCRYDMTDAAQSTTLNGPPLGWNDTYKGETVNGQLFYPLHG